MRKFKLLIGFLAFTLTVVTTNAISKNNQIDKVKADFEVCYKDALEKETETFDNPIIEKVKGESDFGDDVFIPKLSLKDSFEAFEYAVENLKEELDTHINFLGMNIENREDINLPDYDYTYQAPTVEEYITSAYNDLLSDKTTFEISSFENIRKESLEIDEFKSMIECDFTQNYPLKYRHKITRGGFTALAALQNILISSGLLLEAFEVIKGIVLAIKAALSSLLLPWVGWAIFVGTIVIAVAALVVWCVQNWDVVCQCWHEFQNWFHDTFPRAAEWFDSCFGTIEESAIESITITQETIGSRTFEFQQVQANDRAMADKIEKTLVENPDWILLMQNVNSRTYQIDMVHFVNFAFCMREHTHYDGKSSITKYSSLARELILFAGTGYTTILPQIDSQKEEEQVLWPHFHNCVLVNNSGKTSGGRGQVITDEMLEMLHFFRDAYGNIIKRDERQPQHWSHSFFLI